MRKLGQVKGQMVEWFLKKARTYCPHCGCRLAKTTQVRGGGGGGFICWECHTKGRV